MRAEPKPKPEARRKVPRKKWLTCPDCFKQALADNTGRMRHYRGCKRSWEWHREALSGKDVMR